MNYHKLKILLDVAGADRERSCGEHCTCHQKQDVSQMPWSEKHIRLRHGSLVAIDIEFAESILRDLLSLVP